VACSYCTPDQECAHHRLAALQRGRPQAPQAADTYYGRRVGGDRPGVSADGGWSLVLFFVPLALAVASCYGG
jgi:hypothetical protein